MTFIKSLHYCFKISWQSSKICFLCRVIISLTTAVTPFFSVYLSKLIIDSITNKNSNYIIFLLALLMFMNILIGIVSDLSTYLRDLHDEKLRNVVETKIMEQTLNVDIAYFDSSEYLNSLQAIKSNSYTLISVIWNIFLLLSSFISFAIAIVSVASYNIYYVILIIIVTLPSACVDQSYAKKFHNWSIVNMGNERKKYYYQNIACERCWASDVRLYNLKNFILTQYKSIWQSVYNSKKSILRKQFFVDSFANFIPEIAIFILSLNIISKILTGHGTVGDYFFITGILSSLSSSIFALINANVTIYKDRLNILLLAKFEDFESCIVDTGTMELKSDNIEIEFINVSFSYPNCKKKVLSNVSFKINAGEKICLIGINGSGKSTIIKLLLRYYDVTAGEILINGICIKNYTLHSIRDSVSVLFQDITLYATDLKENIAISDVERTCNLEKEVINSLRKAGSNRLLDKLPNGVNTYIHRIFNDDGYEPSGGEAQQIGLARAIYRARPLLVLDEPSSDLDPEAEAKMLNNIINMWKNKTVIFTSHRMSIVHLASRIFVLENGIIVEQGKHDKLLYENGRYAYLYYLQTKNYSKNHLN